jgi:hypothetical protein
MSLTGKAIVGVLKRKATKSVTSWLGAATAAGGGALALDPELLNAIPENVRGYVMLAIGVGVILARHRQEIFELYAKLRAELKAAVDAAEKP